MLLPPPPSLFQLKHTKKQDALLSFLHVNKGQKTINKYKGLKMSKIGMPPQQYYTQ
jgi:hypothetical protein